MKNKWIGVLVLVLGASLGVNILAYHTLTTTPNNVKKIQSNYEATYEKQEKKIQSLTNYINNNTTKALEKESADKKTVETVLYGLFSYNPTTKSHRFDSIKTLVTPEVLAELNPTTESTNASKSESGVSNHRPEVVDEQESLSIKDIIIYGAHNGDYLARYTVTYRFPQRNDMSYTSLTHIKMADNLITHWDQHTLEFNE